MLGYRKDTLAVSQGRGRLESLSCNPPMKCDTVLPRYSTYQQNGNL